MKFDAALIALFMVTMVFPGQVAAQAPDPGIGDVPDPDVDVPDPDVPDPEDIDPQDPPTDEMIRSADEETFVTLESFPCPTPSEWSAQQISGATSWSQAEHPHDEDECVAAWGDGTYRRGSEAALESPGLPTGHLMAHNEHQRVLNDVTTTLLENGVNPRIVAGVVSGLSAGCQNPDGATLNPLFDLCKAVSKTTVQQIQLPEAPAGLGALYFEMTHAYDFGEPDETTQIARDGGWVEIREPGGDWKRIEPVALFEPAGDGIGSACAITAPGVVTGVDEYKEAWHELNDNQVGFGIPGPHEFGRDLFSGFFGSPFPFNAIPSSQEEWEENCQGLVHQTYGGVELPEEFGLFGSGGGESETLDLASYGTGEANTMANRLNPYPGEVRGEGPGFVGDTRDRDGELEFVQHWFDLAPYAGETVEVRFHATGGSGTGSLEGGWWVDETNVRYSGPVEDLSVRLDAPEDGDSFPPGMVPVTATVQNLGRVASQPAQVTLALEGSTETRSVPALEPLEEHRVTALLPASSQGQAAATAEIVLQGDEESTPTEEAPAYTDVYQANNEDQTIFDVEKRQEVSLSVAGVNVTDHGVANVTLEVTNDGNEPLQVPLEAELGPVDLVTRQARPGDADPLGTINAPLVQHGEDANVLGVQDPSKPITFEVDLPEEGLWQIDVSTPIDPHAETAVIASFGDSAPTAFATDLGTVAPGPTNDTQRGGFEIGDFIATGAAEETPAFLTELRNPIAGPETRFVPTGDGALAAYGNELPEDWSPYEHTGHDEDVPFCNPNPTPAPVRILDNCDTVLSEFGGLTLPNEIRSPAQLQMWDVHEHHTSVYGVGTDSTDPQGDQMKAFQDLVPEEDGDRITLEMRHAANVDWEDSTGTKARVMVVPASTLDVAEEIQQLNDTVRDATQPLPPEQRAIASQVLINAGLDQLTNSLALMADQTQFSRLPQDVCSEETVRQFNSLPVFGFCGDPAAISALEAFCSGSAGSVGGECRLPDAFANEMLPRSADNGSALDDSEASPFLPDTELGGTAKVIEITDPTGWEELELDITDIVEAAYPEDVNGNEHDEVGFYVMFDLVKTTDFDEVIASAQAQPHDEGADYTVQVTTNEGNLADRMDGTGTRFGFQEGKAPDWTVDAPELVRVDHAEREQAAWDLCERLPGSNTADCVPIVTQRGWDRLETGDDSVQSSSWRYEARGGNPDSLQPGAFVWTGGTGQLEAIEDGAKIEGSPAGGDEVALILDQTDPEPYSVLRTPTVDLSGYEDPRAEMHVEFSQVEFSPIRQVSKEVEDKISEVCNKARQDADGTVWTQTAWNVRARPVLDDGSLGEPVTVEPVGEHVWRTDATGSNSDVDNTRTQDGGYHDCSEAGHVPVRFDGTAILDRIPTYQTEQDTFIVEPHPECSEEEDGAFETDVAYSALDPFHQCPRVELGFGHGEPVFGLNMPWQDVAFDLSEFRNQEVVLEVHAFGPNANYGIDRGQLKVDDLTVKEGQPVRDLALDHETRTTIAPDTEERFELSVENRGSEPVDEVTIRRTVTDETGCQVVDPVVITRGVDDPSTGEPVLPPGQTTTVRDGRLSWEVPDEPREIFERRFTLSPIPSLADSAPPELSPAHVKGAEAGLVEVGVDDPDDCPEEVDVDTEVLHGDAEIEERSDGGNDLEIFREDAQREERFTTPVVKAQATDPHGVTSHPAYVTPPPELEADEQRVADVDERILQSAKDASGAGSLVEIELDPFEEAHTTQVFIPTEDGPVQRAAAHKAPVQISDLEPGSYLGYALVDGNRYEPIRFEMPLEPEPGSDANPSVNEITLSSEVREDPGLGIAGVVPPSTLIEGEPFDLGIVLVNEGNTPLENVTATVNVDPAGLTITASEVPRMDPGSTTTATVDFTINRPGPQQLTVTAESEEGVTARDGGGFIVFAAETIHPEGDQPHWDVGDPVRFGDGDRVPPDVNAPLSMTGLMDLARSPFSGILLNHSGHLERGYDGIQVEWFDAQGPQQDAMPQKELAGDLTGHTVTVIGDDDCMACEATETVLTQLERTLGFDLRTVSLDRYGDVCAGDTPTREALPLVLHITPREQEAGGCGSKVTGGNTLRMGSLQDPRIDAQRLEQAFDVEASSLPQLAPSHAGAEPGTATPALTGQLDGPGIEDPSNETVAWASGIEGSQTRLTDWINPHQWRDASSFTMNVDSSALDRGNAFWLPTATLLDNREAARDDVTHRLEIPLTVEDWCALGEMDTSTLRINVDERRLFTNGDGDTRGWDATVRLETGELSYFDGSQETGTGPNLEALPVAPPEHEHVTGWESMTYTVDTSVLNTDLDRNAIPFANLDLGTDYLDEGYSIPNLCEKIEETAQKQGDGASTHPGDVTNARLVFELRSESSTASRGEEGLEVGWFLGEIDIDPIDVTVGPSDNNHDTVGCGAKPSVKEGWSQDAAGVRGCTTIVSNEIKRGDLDPHGASDIQKANRTGDEKRVQTVDLGSSTVTNDAGSEIEVLSSLFEEREMDASRELASEFDTSRFEEGFGIEDSVDRFTYADATTLLDLRAGTSGQLVVPVEADSDVQLQVVATPLEPGQEHAETAPTRVSFEPLEPCMDQAQRGSLAQSPLGARDDAIVGVPDPGRTLDVSEDFEVEETTLSEDLLEDAYPSGVHDDLVCLELAPIAGQLSLVTVRAWMPTEGSTLALGPSAVFMDVPDARQLQPQLRALTDDTNHDGTWTLNEAKLLSMAPPFSHGVSTSVTGTETWEPSEGEPVEVLPEFVEPSLVIEVNQPGMDAEWEFEKANVTLSTEHGSADTELELPPDIEHAGSERIEVPWELLRESFEDVDQFAWIAEEPVLPQNVTRLGVDVETTPTRLVDATGSCSASLEDLRESQAPACRALAGLVEENNVDATTVPTENELAKPGVASITVTPSRAPLEAPREAEIVIENPRSAPAELETRITLEGPVGERLSRFSIDQLDRFRLDPIVLDAWETRTLTTHLEIPSDAPDRIMVEAHTGERAASTEFRTTDSHPSELLDNGFFFGPSLQGVGNAEWTSEASKPELSGQSGSGMGWRITNSGGSGEVHGVRSPPVPVIPESGETSLYEMLQADTDPLLVFDHQRDLWDAADSGDPENFAFMAVTASYWDADDERDPSDVHVLGGWAPSPSEERPFVPDGQDPPQDQCIQQASAAGGGDASTTYQDGLVSGEPAFRGSSVVGSTDHEMLTKWETVAIPLDVDALRTLLAAQTDENPRPTEVRFNILLANCAPEDSAESTLLIDNVSLTSGRPLLTIGANQIPIQPGVEKRYGFTLENPASGSETLNVVPSTVPNGWDVRVKANDETLYDSATEEVRSITLASNEEIDGTLRVSVPSDARNADQVLPLTAYSVDAIGASSSAAMNGIVHSAPDRDYELPGAPHAQDPGRIDFDIHPVPLPDLQVSPGSVQVEDAEVGKEATLQFEVENLGRAPAPDVNVRATVTGPSGTEELRPVADPDPEEPGFRADIAEGIPEQFTFSWTPSEAGEHTLRAIVDPPLDDPSVLFQGPLDRFLGEVQEATECVPGKGCPNLHDHTFEVVPLQQPDMLLSAHGLPDRAPAGEEIPIEIHVENQGGATAHDVQLTLTENGLLPVFDTPVVDLEPIPPGETTVIETTWTPVTPGEILLMGSVSASGDFTGTRPDGTDAGADAEIADPLRVDRADVSVELGQPLTPEPGQAHMVNATVINDGTGPVEISPSSVREGDVFLAPVLETPLQVPAGEEATVFLVASASLGTPPQSVTLDVPLDQGIAEATVNVKQAPDATVVLEDRPLDPGIDEIDATITNRGNVPLEGTLQLRGSGLQGDTDIQVGLNETRTVGLPVTTAPDTEPGGHQVATRIDLGGQGTLVHEHRVTVLEASAFSADVRPQPSPLTGSSRGDLLLENSGNMPFDGRITVEGPVSVDDPVLQLEPGELATRTITWVSSAEQDGLARLTTAQGETVAEIPLDPEDVAPDATVTHVETRPSVNLQAGMVVQVVGTVTNNGQAPVENGTLGVTVDGNLYQTTTIPKLDPGATDVISEEIELPRSGSLTLGMADLTKIQHNETAGAVTTVEVAEGSLGLSSIAAIPSLPAPLLVLLLAALAVVRRE